MRDFPTLRIELDGVKYGVIHAFAQSMDEIKDYAAKAIDASMNALREGGLETAIVASVTEVMNDAIDKGIKDAVRAAVSEYFSEGNGKDFIEEAVISYLKKK